MSVGIPPALADLANIDQIVRRVEDLSVKVDAYAKKAHAAGDISTSELQKIGQAVDKLESDAEDAVKKASREIIRELDKSESALGKLDKAWRGFRENLAREMKPGALFGDIDKLLGLGAGLGALTALLPAGGIIGLMMAGVKKSAAWEAAANQAAYNIRTLGVDASGVMGRLRGDVVKLDTLFGNMGAEIKASVAGLASMTGELDGSAKSLNEFYDVSKRALKIDFATGQQPGETAKQIGQTMQQATMSTREAADAVEDLAANLQELHLSYGMFGQGIIQANSALRLQNQSLMDTTRLFKELRGGLKQGGMTDTQAGALALSGIQAGMQAIGGLSEGLQGIIGQRLAQRGVGPFAGLTDPTALITQMQFGMTGGHAGGFASSVFGELRNIAVQRAGTRPGESDRERELRQTFALEKIAGIPPEAARAIIMTGKASIDQLDPAKATAKHISTLDAQFKDYAKNFDQFQAFMRGLENDFARLGTALLGMLVPGVEIIADLLEQLYLFVKEKFGGGLSSQERNLQGALEKHTLVLSADFARAQDTAIDVLGDVGKKMLGAKFIPESVPALMARKQVEEARASTGTTRAEEAGSAFMSVARGVSGGPIAIVANLVVDKVLTELRANGFLVDDLDPSAVRVVVPARKTTEPSVSKAAGGGR